MVCKQWLVPRSQGWCGMVCRGTKMGNHLGCSKWYTGRWGWVSNNRGDTCRCGRNKVQMAFWAQVISRLANRGLRGGLHWTSEDKNQN